jgi:hypothetical protein
MIFQVLAVAMKMTVFWDGAPHIIIAWSDGGSKHL